jgi:prepilin-type N-terminal cleavage/methylation domain-containing protein
MRRVVRRIRRSGRPLSSTRGFTLVELMVTLVIMAVVLGVLVRSLLGVDKSWSHSQDRIDASQNMRAAMDMMVRDLRMAGSGFGGRPVTTGGVPDNLILPCRPAPAAGASDSLFITGALTGPATTCMTAMASPSDGLFVTDTDGFAPGNLVVVTNGVDANMFEVTSVLPATGSLEHSTLSPYNDPTEHIRWPNGGYPPGAAVVQVQRVAYWVDEDQPDRRLMRRQGTEAPLPVAFDVEDLRVTYRLADGTVSASPADPTLIRSVHLDYVPRVRGATGPPDTLSVRVQPRVLG